MTGGRLGRGTPPDLAWQDDAACRDLDPGMFFAGYTTAGTLDPDFDPAPAKAICASCPVTAQCKEYALRSGVLGVWGATDYPQRLSRRPRRNQGEPPAA